MIPRSFLFVPGDSERKQTRALASGADALILDLEDSVDPAQLPAARERVRQFLDAHAQIQTGRSLDLWVRVNAPASGEIESDLRATLPGRPQGFVLPKISTAQAIAEISRSLDQLEAAQGIAAESTRLIVIATETPQALFALQTFAGASRRVAGLTWGMEDLAAAVGAGGKYEPDGSLTSPFELARSLCLFAAAAGQAQAIDGIHADFRDSAGLARDAARARRDGFTAKLAIHPDQIPVINAAFTPGADEIEQAKRVVAAFAAVPGAGVTSLDGKMLDRPHLLLAQRVLERAKR